MSTLHTVNKSPFERGGLASALAHALPGDAILLTEDAVVGARAGETQPAKSIAAAMPGCAIAVLGPDLAARGIPAEAIVPGVAVVDYGGFVDLAATHDKVQSWL
ncbi:MAG: sulfurtransferase complex subunit TusB [Phyllobacteriaceae bacterium]|nr:sulfurtransferase complex subunit TusB [Phyllobacteriaceae bacterium]